MSSFPTKNKLSTIMRYVSYFIWVLIFISCNSQGENPTKVQLVEGAQVIVLGAVQDGGAPHIGCKKDCCADLWQNPNPNLMVSCLGLVDEDGSTYMLDATPDFTRQLSLLNSKVGRGQDAMPDGIFLTHGHIGHYTGLMYLGREAKGAKEVPVYAMPRMKSYLESDGPCSQLVELKNIVLTELEAGQKVVLSPSLSLTPILVPHRDEFSETVGFVVETKKKRLLFIPDIDKWSKWDRAIIEEIAKVDYAFIDATFYDAKEINNRDIAEIPHPFVIESMDLFDTLSQEEKSKIHFIHLNHTNPLLKSNSQEYKSTTSAGYRIAETGYTLKL